MTAHSKSLRGFAVFVAILVITAAAGHSCGSPELEFDGQRAFGYLTDQVDLGPRNPGSPGAAKAIEYFRNFFDQLADTVVLQRFSFTDTLKDTMFNNLTNIVAKFHPEQLPRIMLCAHWDTRPFADHEPDSSLRNDPIPGANDGASGCAVLMELANIIPKLDSRYGIDIVLFDIEDYGDAGHLDYFCIGSKHYVESIPANYYAFGILLDMIGDADLTIYRESFSHRYARRVTDMVWDKAAELGVTSFINAVKDTIYDDHVPFLQNGIPVCDLIDFDYPYWHTHSDTPDKCSPQSLADVGKVLLALIRR